MQWIICNFKKKENLWITKLMKNDNFSVKLSCKSFLNCEVFNFSFLPFTHISYQSNMFPQTWDNSAELLSVIISYLLYHILLDQGSISFYRGTGGSDEALIYPYSSQ